MPRQVIVHHHIFKNAGTSLIWALEQQFGADAVLEWDGEGNQTISALDMRDFAEKHPEAKALSSHGVCLGMPSDDSLNFHSIILLRDPIRRIPSMYHFERTQDAQTPGALAAKKYDIADYVRWRLDERLLTVSNFQTHFCHRQSAADNKRITDPLFEDAKANLTQCLSVGLVEEYDTFLTQTSERLRGLGMTDIELTSTRANTSDQKAEPTERKQTIDELLGQSLADQLREVNAYDYALIDFAKTSLMA